MDKEKIMNGDALSLYEIFKESKEAQNMEDEINDAIGRLQDKMIYTNLSSYQKDFAKIESLIYLRKNLEFYFYQFLPFFIKKTILNSKKELDINDSVTFRHIFYCYPGGHRLFEAEDKLIYCLPAQINGKAFVFHLKKFITQYELGKMDRRIPDNEYEYNVRIHTTLKDLIYACYIGQEWVKSLGEECIDILSDYYSEEQLASFKKTLHR